MRLKLGKLTGFLIAIIVVVLAATSIYNTDQNKISRQLNLGYKYLIDGQYEAAALAFEKVIAIDDKNMEAYANGLAAYIEAYINTGDKEAFQDFYDRAMAAIENAEGQFPEQNMPYVSEIYLFAEWIYDFEPEQSEEVMDILDLIPSMWPFGYYRMISYFSKEQPYISVNLYEERVVAAGGGTVVSVTSDDIWPVIVEVEHGNGYRTRYMCRQEVEVETVEGAQVERGVDTLYSNTVSDTQWGYQILFHDEPIDPNAFQLRWGAYLSYFREFNLDIMMNRLIKSED